MKLTLKQRFDSKWQESESGCWVWTACVVKSQRNKDGIGYGRFSVSTNNPEYAHRVAYRLYRGEIPAGMIVCHRCDNPACVNPDHLFIGSQKDNMVDCKNKGRTGHPSYDVVGGSKNGNAKLSDSDVIMIRKLHPEKTYSQLAKQFSVGRSSIARAVNRETFRNLPDKAC